MLVVGRLRARLWCLYQTWRATRTVSGYAAWHGNGYLISFGITGHLEVLDMIRDQMIHVAAGEPADWFTASSHVVEPTVE